MVCQMRCGRATTLATFNIEKFPKATTDPDRVADLLVEIDADIIAVQEIRKPGVLTHVLERASERSGRNFQAILSTCVDQPQFLSPGIVYDANRLRLIESREYPQLHPNGRGQCSREELPGVLGVFEDPAGEKVAALSVHFRPFPSHFEERKRQLKRTLRILQQLEDEFGAHVVALGDFNTTGFSGAPEKERRFFERTIDDAGYRLTTSGLACSEYWRPRKDAEYLPSLLDHIILRNGDWSAPEVLGMCAELRCEAVDPDDMHPDYERASDHCPVRIEGDW
jgi:endonuclease/exonuclease/phosphatase family metal-dependent hydrolase